MILKVLIFFGKSNSNFDLVVNIFLRSILHSYVSQSQVHNFIVDHLGSISSSVHDIDFGDNSEGPSSLWIPLPGQVETLRSGHVSIGWNNSQNDSSILFAVPTCHLSCHLFNITNLISH